MGPNCSPPRRIATGLGASAIARFSARVLDRAHALDAGTPLGGLATAAAEVLGRSPASGACESGSAASGGEETVGADTSGVATHARPGSAVWRRDVWAAVGVIVENLSNTVLVLGLPGSYEASPFTRSLPPVTLAPSDIHPSVRIHQRHRILVERVDVCAQTMFSDLEALVVWRVERTVQLLAQPTMELPLDG